MWPGIVVFLHPFFSLYLHLYNIFKQVSVQDILTEGTVKALDITVLHRSAWLNILQFDVLICAPLSEFFAQKFRAIFTSDPLRLAFIPNDLLH